MVSQFKCAIHSQFKYIHKIFDWFIAVIGAWMVTSLIMLSSSKLHKLLGKRGLIAIERLMGMVLVAISIQMLLDGINTYFKAMS